ncbi:LysM domain-containing protein [Apilactobacillus timberlakei]|uniref:LysM peptidoglycan-binding domain-containing protein n=1 Tax=Apilactobacillus timberlakei TaxID=2008380 RepID=UPI00112B6C9D|nr:LysM domain-containing protein [Apilactobacillus timberlakei]TPR18917.1 LysM domain-containing protein [Apilactobacillus timberlakei]TPR20918.1 LysM domain-containing protein [Apilactobacillus timberlakei]TPR23569.1 LysM domain-containing protein [Apilactobacillus timberlakei]TPR24923.1 LysM domain-containing protein [Apilactobacillus timberlakei]
MLAIVSISIYRKSTNNIADANTNSVVTVKSGDTLENLSDKYNIFISMLKSANGKYDNSQLLPGDHLLLLNGNNKNSYSKEKKNVADKQQKAKEQELDAKENYEKQWNQANADAKAWISFHESTDSYTAQNGQYYGRYQLDRNYLGGNYSPEHQEQVANQYVSDRYGSWINAKAHWVSNNWY